MCFSVIPANAGSYHRFAGNPVFFPFLFFTLYSVFFLIFVIFVSFVVSSLFLYAYDS